MRGYRSKVDGSVQPYGLIIPESYDGSKPVRLDLVLHGRGNELTEVSFIAAHEGDKPVAQDYITLDVFGRGNNAYRWAGETDVFEALDSVKSSLQNRREENRAARLFDGRCGGVAHRAALSRQVGGGGGGRGIHGDEEVRQARTAGGISGCDAADLRRGGVCRERADGARWWVTAARSIRSCRPARIFARGWRRKGSSRRRSCSWSVRGRRTNGSRARWRESNKFIDAVLAKPRKEPDHIHFVTYTTAYHQCYWISVESVEKQYQKHRSGRGAYGR